MLKITSLVWFVWDNAPYVKTHKVTTMTNTYDKYDPVEHRATGKDVKSGWMLVLLVNIGLVALTL